MVKLLKKKRTGVITLISYFRMRKMIRETKEYYKILKVLILHADILILNLITEH